MERTTEMERSKTRTERSKQVYAIIGLMVLDVKYRDAFFENPHKAANKLVGSLTTDELRQVQRIAGGGVDLNRDEYVSRVKAAFGNLYETIECPTFPCPGPDPFAA
jgi:hypothetical protein